MRSKLTARHLAALEQLRAGDENYLTLGELPRGVGQAVMDQLVKWGLAEIGRSARFNRTMGWRLSAEGRALSSNTPELSMDSPRP